MSATLFHRCVLVLLTALVSPAAAQQKPATRPATVSGRITAEGNKPLPQMVVYLAPVEAGKAFDPPARPAVISQNGAQFSPPLLVICAGQGVEFKNDESRKIEHNVFSQSPARPFDLGLYPPPQSKTVTFDKPGVVRLFCSIHRNMDGMIYVAPTPFHAMVGKDGTYRIENVPPGSYTLRTWQKSPRCEEQIIPIELAEGESKSLDLEMKRK